MEKLKENDVVVGIVTGIESYGIFVNIDEYTGLIHISEISENFVKDVHDYANIGDKIKAKVIEIDEDKHQLKLSIKRLEPPKKKSNREKIKETTMGFSSIENHMPMWIRDKINEINKKL